MFAAADIESIAKASRTADLLVGDIRAMVESHDVLLTELALALIRDAADVLARLRRLESLTRTPGA